MAETEPTKKGVTIVFIALMLILFGCAGYVYLMVGPAGLTGGHRGPVVDVAAPDPMTAAEAVEVRGRLLRAPGGHVLVAGRRVDPDADGMFTTRVPLEPGANAIDLVAVTADGARAEPRTVHVFRDVDPPRVVIVFPEGPHVTAAARVEVLGRIEDERLHPGKALVDGRAVPLDLDGVFRALVDLEEGTRTITVRGVDRAGNESAPVEVVVERDSSPPVIRLLEPSDGARTRERRIAVRGSARDPNLDRVLVNDVPVEIGEEGTFETTVELAEGKNLIEVKAIDAAGNEAEVWTLVVRQE